MLPLGERMRKLQMHYKSVGQKWGDSLQPFPLMCVSDWLKNSEFMSSAVVLMIKCRAASQVGSTLILSGTVLLLTVCTFYTEVVSASCSELTAVCCNVASRLHSWGGWIWCNSRGRLLWSAEQRNMTYQQLQACSDPALLMAIQSGMKPLSLTASARTHSSVRGGGWLLDCLCSPVYSDIRAPQKGFKCLNTNVLGQPDWPPAATPEQHRSPVRHVTSVSLV